MLNKWINIDWIQPNEKYLQHDPLKMTIKNEILHIFWWFSSRINILIFIRTIKIFLLKNFCVFLSEYECGLIHLFGIGLWFVFTCVLFSLNEALLKRHTQYFKMRVTTTDYEKKRHQEKKTPQYWSLSITL